MNLEIYFPKCNCSESSKFDENVMNAYIREHILSSTLRSYKIIK